MIPPLLAFDLFNSKFNDFKVQDASIGGSSDDEDLLGVIRGPSSFANAFLYIGKC